MNDILKLVSEYERGRITDTELIIELISKAATTDAEMLLSTLPPHLRDEIKARVVDFDPNRRCRIWLGESWIGPNAAEAFEQRKRAAEDAYHLGAEKLHRYFFG